VGDGALRHYHELGPSERVEIDADIGCRRDATEQIVTAQFIGRLRDLDMPLEEIRAVLDASDVEIRNRVIANHPGRLETNMAWTETAARALRDLLDGPLASPEIERRNTSAISSMGEARTRSDPFPDVSCG
jgi:DNA-binding transcriptional MerR regulator